MVLAIGFISNLARTNKRLKEEHDFSATVLDSTGAYIVVIDNQGKIVRTNKACEHLTGIASDTTVGLEFATLKLVPEKLVRPTLSDPGFLQETQEEIEQKYKAPESEERVIAWSNSFVPDADDQCKWILCTGLDVTERKRLQRQLSAAQRLEAAGRVAGQIAHDFNNLLSPMTAYPRIISEYLSKDDSLLPLLQEMETSANRIAEINQQLLALGRRGHYVTETIDLHSLLQDILNELHLPGSYELKVDFSAKAFIVTGGKTQLMRALTNLLINAREAINGEGLIKVTTYNMRLQKHLQGYESVEPGAYVRLDISDSGSGILPENLDRIFDPFFSTKTMDRHRGTGLGLSVVHGIIHDHNGYITVTSAPGAGTTFSIHLPLAKVQLLSQDEPIINEELGGQEMILIVDDEPAQRNVAYRLLTRLGYQVNSVDSGLAAISFVKEHQPDLILIDMLMEGMDGTETYEKILQVRPDQKAIILSGYAMSDRVQEALNMGAAIFVSKPIRPDVLAQEVRQALDQHPVPIGH